MLFNLLKSRPAQQGPSLLNSLLELRCATFPLSLTVMAPTLAALPKGDGHPVLVIPGFTATDIETFFLRKFLTSKNYRVHSWNLGRNVGPNAGLEQRIIEKTRALVEVYGSPVTIIGWSLGGMFARFVAHQVPEHVRQVITLGSPFGLSDNYKEASPAIVSALQLITGRRASELINYGQAKYWQRTPPVPTTSIYTYTDGIVHWKSCIDPLEHQQAENVSVPGSHIGLVNNPLVLAILADRLAQDPKQWLPYKHQDSTKIFNTLLSPFELMS